MKQTISQIVSCRVKRIAFLWILLNGFIAFSCIFLMALARTFGLIGMDIHFYLALFIFTLIEVGNLALLRLQPFLFISTAALNGVIFLLFGDITLVTFIPHIVSLLYAFF